MSLFPTKEQIKALRAGNPEDTVVMINMLMTKDAAQYKKYGEALRALLKEYGGKVIWGSQMRCPVIGENVPAFDSIYLVQYPNHETFLAMTSSETYLKVKHFREAGLESQWLIATTPEKHFE